MMCGRVEHARLSAGYKFLDLKGNVTICFLPALLQIINEKISTPKKVVLFGLPPGICLTELL